MGTTTELENSNPASTRKRRRSTRQKHSFRVLLCDSIDQAGADILSSIAEVDSRAKMREDELLKIIGDYHALVVRSGTSVSEKVINQGRQLRIIGRAGVGVDNVCVDAATAKGIFVVNSPHGNTVAAAELTLGLMIGLSRRIPQADASVSRGEWKRNLFIGKQLQQKVIGIIGLGQVGTHVARVCQALGMHVLAYDPFITEAKAKAAGCRLAAGLSELLSLSDVVTLHVPLLDATRHLINKETLKLTKKGMFIINAARGGVVDEEALAEALVNDHIGGAALDVYEKEGGLSEENPLLKAKHLGKNVIFTPHIGASTAEAQYNVAVDVALQVKTTLLGGTPAHAINLQVVQSQHLKNHLHVADILGRLCSRLVEQPVQQLHLRLRGEATVLKNGDADALLLAAAQGMLRTRCDGVVNFVNVKRVAQEHRLQLVVSREAENSGPRELLIELTLQTATETATLSGCSSSNGGVVLKSFLGTAIDLPIPITCDSSSSSTQSAGFPRRSSMSSASRGSSSNSNAHVNEDVEAAAAAVKGVRQQQQQHNSSGNKEEEGDVVRGDDRGGGNADVEEDLDEEQKNDSRSVYMMYTLHRDQPGTLASVAQLLGEAGVNVANCHLGRRPLSPMDEAKEEEEKEEKQERKEKEKKGKEDDRVKSGYPTSTTIGSEEEGKRKGRDNWMGLCIFLADTEITDEVVQKIRALKRVHDCKVFATPQTLLGAGR